MALLVNRDDLPKSWSAAVEAGSRHYFTGKECRHGHIEVRLTSTGVCRECARISARQVYRDDPVAAKNIQRVWRAKNKETINAGRRAARAADPEPRREADRQWRLANPDKVRSHRRNHYDKVRNNPRTKLHNAVRSGVNIGIKRGSKTSRRTFDLLGYSLNELMRHIEAQFSEGMSWSNYGEWEVDHIIPQSVFNFETPDDPDFSRCWSLSNLQPLWKAENRRKNDRIERPFQPSLMLRGANDNKNTDGATNAA